MNYTRAVSSVRLHALVQWLFGLSDEQVRPLPY